MNVEKIEVQDGLYGAKLLTNLWHKKNDNNFDKEILAILEKLCKVDLIKERNRSDNLLLTDKEKEIVNSTDIITACSNKEIIARWCDYVQEFDKNKRQDYIKYGSANYQIVFEITKDYEYLIRQLQLIRKAEGIFTTKLDEIYAFCKEEIIKSKAPFWQHLVIKEVVGIFGNEKCQQDFSVFLEESIEMFNKEKKFSEARLCMDSLHHIGSLTSNQWHIKKAENFEIEADFTDGNRKPKTYYPNLSEIYLKGLREINSVAKCNALRKRLENKVARTQAENVDMIRSVGIHMMPKIDDTEIDKIISELNIDSFETGFQELISIPIVPETIINNYVNISISSSSPLMELFSGTIQIDDRGAKTGSAIGENVHINNARSFHRQRYIAIIRGIKHIMDINKETDMQFVFDLIQSSQSKFIPKDRFYIYAEGIYEGFSNNFMLAAHLLVLQLENSFRYIASQNGIETTQWTNDLQHQNMFGGSLEKIKDFTNSSLHKELSNFLVDNNSNFRNDLCHGLLNPNSLDYYGSYVWWLSLKMIFQTESYFFLK